MGSKFKVGETVLYKNGNTYELGVVKEIIAYERTYRIAQKQDGLHGEPSGEEVTDIAYKYRVNYHTGDTSALTDEHLLIKLINEYAFLVVRRVADSRMRSLDTTPARQLACRILTGIIEEMRSEWGETMFDTPVEYEPEHIPEDDPEDEELEPGLFGDSYYSFEDLITKIINDFKIK